MAERSSPFWLGMARNEQRASYSFNVAAGLMALHRYVTGPTELELIEKALTFYTERNDRLKVSMAAFLRAMILLFGDELERASTGFESLLAIVRRPPASRSR